MRATRWHMFAALASSALSAALACSTTEGSVLSEPQAMGPGGPDASATGPGAGAFDGAAPPSTCDVPTPWPAPAVATTVVGSGTASTCTVQALQAAVDKGGLITFDCGVGNVTIPVITTIRVNNDSTTTILDGGGRVTLDGGGTTRILRVDAGQVLSVRNLTLQNASSVPSAADVADAGGDGFDQSPWQGAALRGDYRSKMEIINSHFLGNRAVQGGAIFTGSDAELTIVGSTFSGNTAWNEGAMKTVLSQLTIVNTVFDGNSTFVPSSDIVGNANEYGGTGAFATNGTNLLSYIDGGVGTGGTISVCGTVVTNNKSPNGAGGLFLWAFAPDNIIVKQSTFANNQGGGIGGAGRVSIGPTQTSYSCTPEADGGKNCTITTPGTLTIESSSVLSNTSAGNAGGLYVDCLGECTIKNSTFYDNNSTNGVGSAIQLVGWGPDVGGPGPGLHLRNVTFAHNGDKRGYMTIFGSGFVIDNTVFESSTPICDTLENTGNTGSNVIQWMPAGAAGIGFSHPCVPGALQITTDPNPLPQAPTDNGGPTKTILPAADGPLVNAGSGCETADQRGVPRDVSKCTIGAVEVGTK